MYFGYIFFILLSTRQSYQLCTSTVGVTTCKNEILQKNKPLRIIDYKPFITFGEGNVEEVPANTFKFLPQVKTIYLSNNQIKNLEVGCFDGVPELQDLSLYNNRLSTIKNGIFSSCRKLKNLNMGMNRISNIERGAFKDLSNLEELNLGFNRLETVPEDINSLVHLKILNLPNNQIKEIKPNNFNGLKNLKVLNLDDNKLRQIPSNAFNGLSNLKDLNLKSNYLTALDVNNIVDNLKSLSIVRLSINSFSCGDLRDIISKFEKNNVAVAEGFSKSIKTVNGISC